MARRKRHKWMTVLMFPVTVKEARSIHDPDDGLPPVDFTPDRMSASLTYCSTCKDPYTHELAETWCPGERDTYEVPLP